MSQSGSGNTNDSGVGVPHNFEAPVAGSSMETSGEVTDTTELDRSNPECAICLDNCVFPVELPCHHTFCYLCVKGVAVQATQQGVSPKCSICRRDIPYNVLSKPHLKDTSALYKQNPSDTYQWYYECRSGGWWQFEERLTEELEIAYAENRPKCHLLIAGQMYEVDFQQMVQYRPNNRNIVRRIKRDIATSQKKGIAGIRISGTQPGQNSSSQQTQPGNDDSSGSLAAIPSALVTPDMFNNAVHVDYDDEDNSDEDDGLEAFWDSDEGSFDEDSVDDDDDMELMESEVTFGRIPVETMFQDSEDDEVGAGDEDEDGADCSPREGARAPTSRSDRSTTSSLNNQTPPPPPPPSATPASPTPSTSQPGTSSGSRFIILNPRVRITVDVSMKVDRDEVL